MSDNYRDVMGEVDFTYSLQPRFSLQFQIPRFKKILQPVLVFVRDHIRVNPAPFHNLAFEQITWVLYWLEPVER